MTVGSLRIYAIAVNKQLILSAFYQRNSRVLILNLVIN